jgi:hypothetical protein
MKTKRQEELITSFLFMLGDEIRPLYLDVIMYLSELGYNPSKEKSNISFKHDLHNKQIAKIGVRKNKEHSSFFALRFSACRDYSQKFYDIVTENIIKYPTRAARCINNACNFCAGEANTHVYTCIFPDGESKTHCGAYAIEIPNITLDDIGEIKKLIKEEHEYLLKHEAGVF